MTNITFGNVTAQYLDVCFSPERVNFREFVPVSCYLRVRCTSRHEQGRPVALNPAQVTTLRR
jgi:hypothetical protein